MKKTLKLLLSSTLLLTGILASCGEKPTSEASQEQSQQTSEPAVPEALKNADSYIHSSFCKDMALETPATYSMPAKYLNCTIEWSVVVKSGEAEDVKVVPAEDGNTVSIVVRELDDEHVSEYTLTYVVKLGEDSLTRSYDHKVPTVQVFTPEQYYAAKNDTLFAASGVVTCLIPSQKSLYLQAKDGSGSFYIYQAKNYEAIAPELGQELSFVGKRATYSGTAEVTNATLKVVSAEKVAVAPTNYTEVFKNATDMKDANLVAKQGLLVKIEGVTIAYEENTNGYYHFTLGGNKSYVRISSSSCPLTKDEQTAFINGHKDHVGWTANVQGIINLYDGAFYLTPVAAGAEEYVSLPAKTDAEAVEYEKGILTFVEKVEKSGEIVLQTAGKSYPEQVAISWASEKPDVIAISEDGTKATVTTQDEETEVKLTATLTAGAASDTKEFTVKVASSKIEWIDAAKAIELTAQLDGDKKEKSEGWYYIYGDIVDDPTADYCNFNFENATGDKIKVYGLYTEDGAKRYGSKRDIETLPVAKGDRVCLYGQLQNYSGTLEIINARLQTLPEKGSAICNPLTAAEVRTMVMALADTKATEEKYYIQGVVSDVPTADYCNFHFEGGEDLVVYGLWDADHTQRYGTKRQIEQIPFTQGDTVVILGQLQKYVKAADQSITPEVVNADLLKVIKAPAAPVEYVYVGDGTEANPYTVEDCLERAKEFSVSRYDSTNKVNVYGDLAMVYVKGVVAVEGSDKGAYQQNMQLQSTAEGKKLTIYTVNEAETVKDVRLNDEVVIKGYLMNYNGTIEISNAKGAEDAEPIYPEFISVVRGTNAISVDAASSANAHVALDAETGANESEFTFEVTVDDGYDLVAVTVNGVAVEKDAETNKYTGKVSGATVVKVTTKEAGAEVAKSFTWEYKETITDGYKLDASASAKDTYYQDKSGSEGFALTFTRLDNEKIYEGTPEGKISLTVKVGGGSKRDPLNNNVIAYLIDATGAKIEGSEVVVTTKVEETTGKEYTVELPQVADAYGLVISHEKEASYNARVFSVSFTYPEA